MLRRATELDPRSVQSWLALTVSLIFLHRYPEALTAIDQGLAVDPTSFRAQQLRAIVFLGQGDFAGAQRSLAAVPRDLDQAAFVAYLGNYNDLFWVLTRDQQTLLLTLPPSAFDNDRGTWGGVMAQTYWLRGDQAKMRAYADSARVVIEAELRDAALDSQLHVFLGLALAYLGRKADAIREGLRGLELARRVGELSVPYIQHQLARVYVLVGQPEEALDQLESILKVPYYLSPDWLRIDPNFAALKGNPRFERLVAAKPGG